MNWNDEKFQMDLKRWKKILNIDSRDWIALSQILYEKKEYRNLFIYRNRFRVIYRMWIQLFYKPESTLFIETKEIGGGLFIQHGFSTMIAAESIGENCWINQQVTIGYGGSGERPPIIGNDVMITCGAKVLGKITVGNDVTVGANAVVIRDVENHSIVGGVPAHKIK